jgi:hypothetical protein
MDPEDEAVAVEALARSVGREVVARLKRSLDVITGRTPPSRDPHWSLTMAEREVDLLVADHWPGTEVLDVANEVGETHREIDCIAQFLWPITEARKASQSTPPAARTKVQGTVPPDGGLPLDVVSEDRTPVESEADPL